MASQQQYFYSRRGGGGGTGTAAVSAATPGHQVGGGGGGGGGDDDDDPAPPWTPTSPWAEIPPLHEPASTATAAPSASLFLSKSAGPAGSRVTYRAGRSAVSGTSTANTSWRGDKSSSAWLKRSGRSSYSTAAAAAASLPRGTEGVSLSLSASYGPAATSTTTNTNKSTTAGPYRRRRRGTARPPGLHPAIEYNRNPFTSRVEFRFRGRLTHDRAVAEAWQQEHAQRSEAKQRERTKRDPPVWAAQMALHGRVRGTSSQSQQPSSPYRRKRRGPGSGSTHGWDRHGTLSAGEVDGTPGQPRQGLVGGVTAGVVTTDSVSANVRLADPATGFHMAHTSLSDALTHSSLQYAAHESESAGGGGGATASSASGAPRNLSAASKPQEPAAPHSSSSSSWLHTAATARTPAGAALVQQALASVSAANSELDAERLRTVQDARMAASFATSSQQELQQRHLQPPPPPSPADAVAESDVAEASPAKQVAGAAKVSHDGGEGRAAEQQTQAREEEDEAEEEGEETAALRESVARLQAQLQEQGRQFAELQQAAEMEATRHAEERQNLQRRARDAEQEAARLAEEVAASRQASMVAAEGEGEGAVGAVAQVDKGAVEASVRAEVEQEYTAQVAGLIEELERQQVTLAGQLEDTHKKLQKEKQLRVAVQLRLAALLARSEEGEAARASASAGSEDDHKANGGTTPTVGVDTVSESTTLQS